MKKQLFMLMLLVLVCTTASAQRKLAGYAVGFYNLENLFDYTHDEGKNDYEFLPDGSYHWNEMKYTHKLHNMSRVLAEMGTDKIPDGCAFIGVSEVENDHVLTDLVAQPSLAARNFKFCHIEGPDRRGIDCALLYNPKYYKVNNVKLVPYVPELAKDSTFKTRGFLTVSGELAGEHVDVIVCHWPSRFSGSFYRETAGREVRAVKDSLLKDDRNVKVFIMGDMNDDPFDESMVTYLHGKETIAEMTPQDYYNPYLSMIKAGYGSLCYQGTWCIYDQELINYNLAVAPEGGLKIQPVTKGRGVWYDGVIFKRPFMTTHKGQYKGYPFRTFSNGAFVGGYSDHYPTYIVLGK